jgi:hypothetical protein
MGRLAAFVLTGLLQATGVPSQLSSTPPDWIVELKDSLGEELKTEVAVSSNTVIDHVDGQEHGVTRLSGKGALGEVSDPFEVVESYFLSEDWRPDRRYLADGHGSSSRAFRRGDLLCISTVTIDSSDDDEETGHVPSVFWFRVDCREVTREHTGRGPEAQLDPAGRP